MQDADRPGVIVWFKVYCWILAVMYFFVAMMSIPYFWLSGNEPDMPPVLGILMGAVFLLVGLVLLTASLLGVFLKPRPWVWVYNLVLICIGMTSACFLPACVPLLIFWIKDDTKRYYGRPAAAINYQ